MIALIRDFVAHKNDVPAEELKDLEDEFGRSNEADQYFFSSNRYIFKASKPCA